MFVILQHAPSILIQSSKKDRSLCLPTPVANQRLCWLSVDWPRRWPWRIVDNTGRGRGPAQRPRWCPAGPAAGSSRRCSRWCLECLDRAEKSSGAPKGGKTGENNGQCWLQCIIVGASPDDHTMVLQDCGIIKSLLWIRAKMRVRPPAWGRTDTLKKWRLLCKTNP